MPAAARSGFRRPSTISDPSVGTLPGLSRPGPLTSPALAVPDAGGRIELTDGHMQDIATTIRTARIAAPMSQEQLALAARLSRKTVSRVEGGETPSAETLLALCSVLQLDASALASGIPLAAGPALPSAEDLAAMATWPHDAPERKAFMADLAKVALLKVPGVRAMVSADVVAYRDWLGRIQFGSDPSEQDFRRRADALRRRAATLRLMQRLTLGVPAAALALTGLALWLGLLPNLAEWLEAPVGDSLRGMRVLGPFALLAGFSLYIVGALILGTHAHMCITDAESLDFADVAVSYVDARAYATGDDGVYVLTRKNDTVEVVHLPPSRVDSFKRDHRLGHVTYVFDMTGGRERADGFRVAYHANRQRPGNDVFEIPFVGACETFEAGLAPYRNRTAVSPASVRLDEIHALAVA